MATTAEELKRYLVISDLHIGIGSGDPSKSDTSRSSDYYFDDDQTYAYLLQRIQEGNTVILNGDIFELWETDISVWKKEVGDLAKGTLDGKSFLEWHKGRAKDRFDAIRKKYPKTIDLILTNPNIIYINGNHDEACRTQGLIPNAKESFIITQGGFSIFVAHGHQADQFCSGAREGCGRFLTCCTSIGEQVIDPDLDVNLSKLADTFKITHDSDGAYGIHALKTAEAAPYGYDAAIYGHTHVQQLTTIPTKSRLISGSEMIYANIGKCCHSDAHDRCDEIAITIGKNLVITMQQRSLLSGQVQLKYRISKTTDGFFKRQTEEQLLAELPSVTRVMSQAYLVQSFGDLTRALPDGAQLHVYLEQSASTIPSVTQYKPFADAAARSILVAKKGVEDRRKAEQEASKQAEEAKKKQKLTTTTVSVSAASASAPSAAVPRV